MLTHVSLPFQKNEMDFYVIPMVTVGIQLSGKEMLSCSQAVLLQHLCTHFSFISLACCVLNSVFTHELVGPARAIITLYHYTLMYNGVKQASY